LYARRLEFDKESTIKCAAEEGRWANAEEELQQQELELCHQKLIASQSQAQAMQQQMMTMMQMTVQFMQQQSCKQVELMKLFVPHKKNKDNDNNEDSK